MKTGTVILLLGGVAVLGLGFVVLTRKKNSVSGVPTMPMQMGAVNTPQQQFAALTGTLASQLATTGINKLKNLFN